ncbi:MAG: penicillin acylase family protein, partial [Gammaproteobacteria bacterium]|nr:penicillin acylase family protein [Gammaproteobacteria bacterium]
MQTRSLLSLALLTAIVSLAIGSAAANAQGDSSVNIEGLDQRVEILKDKWGISHIYAQTEHDLFFAQGYSAARDRLFQFEIWRAQATGTTAALFGPRMVDRDHGTRLFKFRGPMADEMNHYHPRGVDIITAFVHGVNAYIDEALDDPDSLPLPFKLLGIQPQHWTEEVVISRHQGLLGNIGQELNIGRAVCAIGEDAVRELQYFHPHDPILTLDPMIDCESLLENDILHLYTSYRSSIKFEPNDIVASTNRNTAQTYAQIASAVKAEDINLKEHDLDDIGSNNWVVSGDLTQDGWPMMINDPHR